MTGLDEREDARFDRGDGDAIGFAQVVARHGHQTRNCSGGWHLLQILIRGVNSGDKLCQMAA